MGGRDHAAARNDQRNADALRSPAFHDPPAYQQPQPRPQDDQDAAASVLPKSQTQAAQAKQGAKAQQRPFRPLIRQKTQAEEGQEGDNERHQGAMRGADQRSRRAHFVQVKPVSGL